MSSSYVWISGSPEDLQPLVVRRRDGGLLLISISPCTATIRGPLTRLQAAWCVYQVCAACTGKMLVIKGPDDFDGARCVRFHDTVLLSCVTAGVGVGCLVQFVSEDATQHAAVVIY